MAAAFLDQGKTAIRDSLKVLVTHVGVSTDSTAFAGTQTRLDPSGTAVNLIKAASKADSGAAGDQFDATIVITGSAEFTNQTIRTIGVLKGGAPTDALSRSVRTAGIGVQAGDVFTIGARLKVEDNS